jgi:serine/threonine-protein phosphatase 2B catalytic subunit
MLVAVLNTCTKEELEEHDEDLPIMSPATVSVETAERRKIIKNKIMAVGRMARVFALLRYVVQMALSSSCFNIFRYLEKSRRRFQSSRVSLDHPSFHTVLLHLVRRELEMRSMDLMMRASFFRLIHYLTSKIFPRSRKSDIENERLPPDLFDADSEEGKAILGSSSLPSTPAEGVVQPAPPPNGVAEGLEKAIAAKITPSRINTGTSSLSQPSSISPISASGSKKGHSRQASLGTTMTSPSNRRRSLESTMSLIQGVLDGKPARIEEHDDMNGLTDKLAGSSVGKNASQGPGRSPAPAR